MAGQSVRREFGQNHFESFSGADMRAVFGSREIGELQAISYAIQREKAPIYVMGHKNPRAFSRGKRGIAGTCVFVMFDGHVLLQEMGLYADGPPNFLSSKDEYRPSGESDGLVNVNPISDAFDLTREDTSVDFEAGYETAAAWYVDQIPPFDVTITAANEYGAAIVMRIIGVELLNEAWGISVDDIVSEQQYSYVARAINPWKSVQKWTIGHRNGGHTVYSLDSAAGQIGGAFTGAIAADGLNRGVQAGNDWTDPPGTNHVG